MADTGGRALYLSWRPRRFDDVVGQRHVVRTIRNAVKQGTIAHAYLFSGPRGTGKTSMARLLFKAVNCLNPQDGGPCEACAICTSANEGRSLDLIELDAASNRGIDDIRDLRDKINYAPAEARYRVYILDEAHQLTQAAWDALLKTLEEPPPHAILVLATTEAHKVPATVLSRCQRFDFHRHTASDIRERLALIASSEGVEVDPTVLSWLARAARGGMRDAISLLDQLRAFCGERIDTASAREVLGLAGLETVRPFLEALQDDRPGDALEDLNEAVERGTDLRTFVGDSLTYLRALLLLRYGAVAALRQELPDDELSWLEDRATAWPAGRLRSLVGGFGEALARFRDPAQLLIQIELTLLGSWDVPDEAAAGRPAAATSTRESTTSYTTGFVPARAAREASSRPPEPTTELGGAASVTSRSDLPPTSSPSPPASSSFGAASAGRSDSAASDGARTRVTPPSPALPSPAGPPPADHSPAVTSSDMPSAAPRGESTVPVVPVSGSTAPSPASEPVESSASPSLAAPRDDAGGGDGGRPLWDDDDWGTTPTEHVVGQTGSRPTGQGDVAPGSGPPTNGRGATSPVHRTAASTGAVSAAPSEQDARGATQSSAAVAATSTSTHGEVDGRLAPTDTSHVGGGTAPLTLPALEFDILRRTWPEVRSALVGGRLERMATLGMAELVDVQGRVLVVKVTSGHLKLLDGEQQRRELRGDLATLLGGQADVRFVDDYVRQARPAGGAEHSTAAVAPPEPLDPLAAASLDPVIQCGLRLFGGPLVRIEDGSEPPQLAPPASPAPAAPASTPSGALDTPSPPRPAPTADQAEALTTDEDIAESDNGTIIGAGGHPVRDWYNY